MFSNTAYEALYKYLGLMFHSGSIKILTSEPFFKGLLLIIFGGIFMATAWKFTGRHIMGNLVKRYNVPVSQFVKIILCLVVGISILRIGTDTQVKDFDGVAWSENPYVKNKVSDVTREYQVSFVFDIMSRTAEELTRYVSYAGEYIFGTEKDSYLRGPHGYAKAIMLAGSATINDPKVQKLVDSYTRNCVMRVLGSVKEADENLSNLSGLYNGNSWINSMLEKIPLSKKADGRDYTCLDLKTATRSHLKAYAGKVAYYPSGGITIDEQTRTSIVNASMSSMLNSYYKGKKETFWGIHEGSQVPGTAGTAFQYMNRFFSWDTLLSVFGKSKLHGASEAAKRAQDFSEMLARAPHIKGITQMMLIGIFPWLIFFIVAGKYKVLFGWFWLYLSVCMWTPIWTIMYHIMNNVSNTAGLLQAYGNLSDGISLYAADVVMERIYYSYSVFTMAQTMVPVFTTGMVVYFLKPLLFEAKSETAPEFINDAKGAASNVAGVASSVATGMPK